MTVYGYARVSTGCQELDIQLALLREAGCTKLCCEKESGIKDHRRGLNRLLECLRPGDVLIVSALDRLSVVFVLVLSALALLLVFLGPLLGNFRLVSVKKLALGFGFKGHRLHPRVLLSCMAGAR